MSSLFTWPFMVGTGLIALTTAVGTSAILPDAETPPPVVVFDGPALVPDRSYPALVEKDMKDGRVVWTITIHTPSGG